MSAVQSRSFALHVLEENTLDTYSIQDLHRGSIGPEATLVNFSKIRLPSPPSFLAHAFA